MKVLLGFFLCSAIGAFGQGIQVTNIDGGSVSADIFGRKAINEKSSLKRRWILMNDPLCPLQLLEGGVRIVAEGGFYFNGFAKMASSSPVRAVELRYVLYDVFNNPLGTMLLTDVSDVSSGTTHAVKANWETSGTDAQKLLTVVVFVAQVRGADENTWRCNEKAVVQQLERLSLKSADVLPPNKT